MHGDLLGFYGAECGPCMEMKPLIMGFGRMNMLVSKKKPEWLRTKLHTIGSFGKVRQTVNKTGLNTVCESAHCPNISECWSGGTATFIVMGDVCTRGCKFCAVKTGNPMKQLDRDE